MVLESAILLLARITRDLYAVETVEFNNSYILCLLHALCGTNTPPIPAFPSLPPGVLSPFVSGGVLLWVLVCFVLIGRYYLRLLQRFW